MKAIAYEEPKTDRISGPAPVRLGSSVGRPKHRAEDAVSRRHLIRLARSRLSTAHNKGDNRR